MGLSRRTFTRLGILSSLLPLGKAFADVAPQNYSDNEVAEILIDEGGGVPESQKAIITDFWFQQPEGTRPNAHWPEERFSYDYEHLSSINLPDKPFSISAEDIITYMAACYYPILENNILLFGLRGASLLTGSSTTFAESHEIKETVPDHINARCLLGVLDLSQNKLALFAGSTVPNVDLMQKQAERVLACNMMPTGAHLYVVGAHKGAKQPGAFRQLDPVWVHRANGELVYSFNVSGNIWDDSDGSVPADNIHAAVLSYRTRPPFFSSAGCQVVAGAYDKGGVPIGEWESFRRAAGLSHPPVIVNENGATTDDGRRFQYILLTGKEARMLHAGEKESLRSIRFGSQGEPVRRMQKFLSKESALDSRHKHGSFDRFTVEALLHWQIANKSPPTAIVAKKVGSDIGLW